MKFDTTVLYDSPCGSDGDPKASREPLQYTIRSFADELGQASDLNQNSFYELQKIEVFKALAAEPMFAVTDEVPGSDCASLDRIHSVGLPRDDHPPVVASERERFRGEL